MKKVVVLTSGGMDSAVLLAHHVKGKDEVRAIAFDYGQRHRKELVFARMNAEAFGIPFTAVDLRSLAEVLPGSSQTDYRIAVPEGRYDEESMKATVVPNRNMILLSIAIGHAIAYKMGHVAYAAHAGDHSIYPDCRPEFADWINEGPSTGLCDWTQIQLLRPFINFTKSQVVTYGKELGVKFERTWSCYVGGEVHCGRCGTCVERREAFYLSKVFDRTIYDQSAPSVEEMVANHWKLPTSV